MEKVILPFLSAVLAAMFTSVGAYMMLVPDLMKRQEIQTMVKETVRDFSPYNLEREYIRSTLTDNRSLATKALSEVGGLKEAILQLGHKLDRMVDEQKQTRIMLNDVFKKMRLVETLPE
jgi:hypothetical protein